MFCLVYRSTASPVFEKVQISEMLDKARVFNKKSSITGCLIYYNGEFLQYLEGSQVEVLSLYDKIKTDPRHTKVRVLSSAEIRKREFDQWSMAYEDFLGDNNELQFLKLLTSSYIDTPEEAMDPNPTSLFFWRTAKRLLHSKPSNNVSR